MLYTRAVELFQDDMDHRGLREKTIEKYSKDLRYFKEYMEENNNNAALYLDRIGYIQLKDYINYRRLEGKSISTINGSISTLRQFFHFLLVEEIIEEDPSTRLVLYRKSDKVEKEVLSIEDLELLFREIEGANSVVAYLVYTMGNTGLRIAEARNLRLEDVDLVKKQIDIIDGKGGKNARLPLSQKLVEALELYLEKIRPKSQSPYFFAEKRTGRVSRSNVNRHIKEAGKRLGWKKSLSSHNLRHSFCTNLLVDRGVDLVTTRDLMRHENIATTGRYLHTDTSRMVEAVNRL